MKITQDILVSISSMNISLKINLLLLILFGGVLLAGYTSILQLQTFHNDALSINNLGIVRGSIQRITKNELNFINSDWNIRKVDTILTQEKIQYQTKNIDIPNEELKTILQQFYHLESAWLDLKKQYVVYRSSKINSDKIIEKSEICWEKANKVVYSAQKMSEIKHEHYKQRVITILTAVSVFILGIIYLVYKIVHKNLEVGIITDPMTNLFNRNHFNEILQKQITLNSRYSSPFSLILCDVDFFKDINDEFGHQQGDKVLVHLASLLQNNARENDYVFRIGGEEFALIFPHTNQKQAAIIADKFRQLVSEVNFGLNKKITISIGVCECSTDEGAEALFRRADNALYQAKSSGRNKVVSEPYQHIIDFC